MTAKRATGRKPKPRSRCGYVVHVNGKVCNKLARWAITFDGFEASGKQNKYIAYFCDTHNRRFAVTRSSTHASK